jgi:SAM-dependent methyltransferase
MTMDGRPVEVAQETRRILNVGCGTPGRERLHAAFHDEERWQEVRLDVDKDVNPDIVCSITDMGEYVTSGTYDALWSSHTVEHLYDHEAALAFAEFRRVLRPDGFALIRCPDLQAVVEAIRTDGLETVAYVAPAGPVTPLDMLFGFRPSIARGNTFMAHRTGFTDLRIGRMLIEAGFAEVRTKRSQFDLWAVAIAEKRWATGILKHLGRFGLDFKDS